MWNIISMNLTSGTKLWQSNIFLNTAMSRKTFQNVIVFLLLLPFSRAAVAYKRYAVKQEYQNKLFSSSQMVEMYSESLIQCAIQCMNKYSCFEFNDLKHTSRVYEVTISIQCLNGILAGYIILQVSYFKNCHSKTKY